MGDRARVVVVGSSNTDMVVRAGSIPAPGQTVLGGEFLMLPGGKGANQAVAAARLGAHVTFVARLGQDPFGEQALQGFQAEGIDSCYISRDPEAPSGVALICVADDGQNSIVVAPGANGRISPADVEHARPAFEEADVVVVQFEVPVEAVDCTVRLARETGKRVVVNPAPARPLPADRLQGVDVLTPNEVEAAMLLGYEADADLDPEEAARELLSRGVGCVVLTLGSRGALIAAPTGFERVPARNVAAVDTTAAGDCFTGALACRLAEGSSLSGAVRYATAAAALSVTRMGAQPSMPTRSEVEAFVSAG